MLPRQIEELLRKNKFVSIATANKKGEPNVAPKFLMDITGGCVFLIDYVVNQTWKNLQENPLAAIAVVDEKSLTGYQLKGNVTVLSQGREFDRLNKSLKQKIEQMSIDRVIEAVRSGRKSESYELLIPAKIVIFKVKVKEIYIISPTGTVKKEKIGRITVSGDNPVVKTSLGTTTIPLFYPPLLKQLPPALKIVNGNEKATQ